MRVCILVSAFGMVISAGLARTPGFDPKDVVRQVRSAHSTTGSQEPLNPALDDGEFLIDTSGTLGPAPYGQGHPALAFDGVNFLVVWQDGRKGDSTDVYGARVTPAGVVLDPTGIVISAAAENQFAPALAFDGANFLVVWEDRRGGRDIYGARVTPAGVVLDPQGIAISTARGGEDPVPAFDGENFLVVWADYRSDSSWDIYGARVTPAGAVLDPEGISIAATPGYAGLALAPGGENSFVVWEDERYSGQDDINGARVTSVGVVLDTAGIDIATAAEGQMYPALAFDGENFLAVWHDWCRSDIYGARVTPAGVVLDPTGIAITSAPDAEVSPVSAFDGGNFLVVWNRSRGNSWDIYGARVTPAGVVLDPNGIPISTATSYQWEPDLAFDGASFLVVWEDRRNGSDIYGARVTPAGVVLDSGPVVRQEGSQSHPALARGSGNDIFLVYQGWAGSVGGNTYNTQRIWGKMDPNPAIVDMTKPEARITNRGATIVRGVLYLPRASNVMRRVSSVLLDISGRKVMDLHPGANDVRGLAPGVHFVREQPPAASSKPQAIRKVVITR